MVKKAIEGHPPMREEGLMHNEKDIKHKDKKMSKEHCLKSNCK